MPALFTSRFRAVGSSASTAGKRHRVPWPRCGRLSRATLESRRWASPSGDTEVASPQVGVSGSISDFPSRELLGKGEVKISRCLRRMGMWNEWIHWALQATEEVAAGCLPAIWERPHLCGLCLGNVTDRRGRGVFLQEVGLPWGRTGEEGWGGRAGGDGAPGSSAFWTKGPEGTALPAQERWRPVPLCEEGVQAGLERRWQ